MPKTKNNVTAEERARLQAARQKIALQKQRLRHARKEAQRQAAAARAAAKAALKAQQIALKAQRKAQGQTSKHSATKHAVGSKHETSVTLAGGNILMGAKATQNISGNVQFTIANPKHSIKHASSKHGSKYG